MDQPHPSHGYFDSDTGAHHSALPGREDDVVDADKIGPRIPGVGALGDVRVWVQEAYTNIELTHPVMLSRRKAGRYAKVKG